MKKKSTFSSLLSELRERLKHNEAYLAQSVDTRQFGSGLTYGTLKSPEWLCGEDEAIRAGNEWIRALLKDYTP